MHLCVGLTGGIGSGKSTVSAALKKRGAYVVDADAIAREVVAPGSSGLVAVAEQFGPGILNADGSLNRQELAARAFATPKGKAALDAITHPLISERTKARFESAPPDAIVVHDVALLTELGLAPNYDFVVVVDCPDELRVERLVGRGLTEEDARRRITHQATREQRLAIADYLIDNSGDLQNLASEVDRVWQALTKRRADED